jgi:nitrite reductase/ring-hydroxylating ferredoxin subunit
MKKTILNNPLFFIVAIIAISFYYSCKKNRDGNIPLVSVNVNININDPVFIKLTTVGGWEYISGGSRGLLVYRKSQEEFMAYDRHCPYKPSDDCGQVAVDSSNIIAIDKCCNSEFVITDGSVLKGPAVVSLKQYQTSFNGTVLRIYN